MIDSAPFLRGSRFIHGTPLAIDASGRLLTAYTASEPLGPPDPEAGWDGTPMRTEVRVAACEDVTCTGGPTVTVLGEGWWPSLRVDGGAVRITYVTATPPHGDPPYVATAVSCLDPACTSSTRTTTGTFDETAPMAALWDRLVYDAEGVPIRVRTAEVTEPGMVDGEEGPVEGIVVVGEQIVFSRCADAGCSSWTTTVLADLAEGEGAYWYGTPRPVVRSNGLPLVVYGDAEGLHLVRCPDAACTPPD